MSIVLIAHLNAQKNPPPPQPEKVNSRYEFDRLPPQSRYHGGAEERVIEVPNARAHIERLIPLLAFESSLNDFPEIDFFTIDLFEPSRVVVGRRHKVGDLIDGQMVVETDGITAKLLPTNEALVFLSDKEAERQALEDTNHRPKLKLLPGRSKNSGNSGSKNVQTIGDFLLDADDKLAQSVEQRHRDQGR